MKAFSVLTTLVFFFSCSNDRGNSSQPADPVTNAYESTKPRAIYSKSGGRGDLVGKLYDEKLKHSKELRSLDDAIVAAGQYYDSTKTFNDYNEKSLDYYSSANSHAARIMDTILRQKMKNIIASSEGRYDLLISEHHILLRQLETNGNKISDLHAAIKLLLTLPDIENYQKTIRPPANPLQKAVEKQKRVIRKMDSVVVRSGG